MSLALIFPGQGSQDVGMGAEIARTYASARGVLDEVDAALGQKLSDLMLNGPKEELTLTENAQPALMAVSMAVMRVLEKEHGFDLKAKVRCVAGHSLGEYSALAAAGSISIADAARLLKLRGKAMQAAVAVGAGAMAALLGVALEAGEKVAAEAAQGDVCQVANDNGPGQVIISGSKAAVARAAEVGKAHGVRRFMPLNVSAPFHCAMMKPAADAMVEALARTDLRPPAVPLFANVTAAEVTSPSEIRRLLVAQVTGTVRWRESVTAMAKAGVTDFYEIGAGKVLSGLVRAIDRSLNTSAIGAPADILAALPALKS